MKKLSKVLLLTLVLALMCGTVFATVASAATTSENEQALLDAVAGNDAIVRFVEDFTDETIDVSADSDTNTSTSPVYSNLSKGVTFGSWRSVAARGVAYGELRLTGALDNAENPWIAIGGATEDEGMTRVTGSAGNKYAVYEWDMMTATQYPAGFGIYFSAVNKPGAQSYISEVAVSNEDGTLTVGGQTVSLGAAGEWHHYTIVLSFEGNEAGKKSKGAFYQDGELIGDILEQPIAIGKAPALTTKYVESLMIGYYDQTANYALDSSICVDNAVITQMRKGYEEGTDNVAPVFDSTVDDLTTLNAIEYVYTADYQFPVEYSVAGIAADGSYVYYPDFAAAYTAFKDGEITMIELYESNEGAVDAPVVIKAPAGVIFTDTNADEATRQAKIEAVDAEGNTYYTFTNTDKKISYSFYKTAEGGEATVYEFGVGTIPSVSDDFVPVDYISNPDDNSPKLKFNGTWAVYKVVGTEKTPCTFALVTEAEIDAGVTYEVKPNYDVVVPYFEVICEGAAPVPYFDNEDYASAFETLTDGATVKLYKDVGFTATPVVTGTVYVDMNGCALYQLGTEKLNLFDISEGATLYLYSSATGALIYGGASADGACLIANYTGKGTVHVGYKSTEAKDAYADNITAYVGAIVDNAVAESAMNIVGVSFYVVNADYDALVGFAPEAKGITVSMDRVVIYNNVMNAKPLASFDGTLGGNTVTITNSVIYNRAEKLVALVGTNAGDANSVTLTAVTVHGNIKGEADLKITLENGCRFTSIDADTVSVPENAAFVYDNEKGTVTGQYPDSGLYNNRFNLSALNAEASPIRYYLASPDQLAENFCEVEWFFDAKLDSIKEYWVRGIVPDFRHEYPISDERITYSYENVTLPTIAEDATTLKIEALEVAEYDIVGFAHNLSVYIGMDYYFYIPVQSAVVGVSSNGGERVDVTTLSKTEDGVYYVFTVAELEVRNFATVAYELEFFVKTARGYETTLSTSTSPVTYLEGLFKSEETTKETKDLVITFMDYLVKAAAFLSTEANPVDVDSVKEILKGQAVPGTIIDYISDEGGIRYGLSGAHLRLTSKPEYVFTLRAGFVGTITINGDEYVIENAGEYEGKNYVIYDLPTMGDMADELTITVKGTIGENAIDTAGKYCLANYYISQMDENYNTPAYISALYVYVKYAQAYEDAMN